MSNWIKIRTGLINHPKVTRMAWTLCPNDPRRMSIIIGAIVQVWAMADQHADGEALPGMSAQALDLMVGVEGFAHVMRAVGWLEEAEDCLLLPNYAEHNGANAKKRASDQKRRKHDASEASILRQNATKRAKCSEMDASEASVPLQNAIKFGPEKREIRKEEIQKQSPPPPALGKSFDPSTAPRPFASEEFAVAWGAWCRHRLEIKKKITPETASGQLGKLAAMGETRAIAAIRHSIAGGWTGIFEPDSRAAGHGGPQARASPLATAQAASELVSSGNSAIANGIYARMIELEEERNGMA